MLKAAWLDSKRICFQIVAKKKMDRKENEESHRRNTNDFFPDR